MSVCTVCNVVSLLTTSVNFNTPLTMIALSMGRHIQSAWFDRGWLFNKWHDRNSSGLPPDSCPTFPLRFPASVPTQPSLGSILALQIRHRVLSRALSSNHQGATSQCSRYYSLQMACFSFFFFFVPSGQLFHRSNGFTQFCIRLDVHNQFRQLSVSVCFAHQASALFNRCFIILWWSVGSMVSKIPILQICNAVVVLEAETGFVPTSAQLFAVRNFLKLKSPSCTRSCNQKYRVSMCFVLGPGLHRSVKEFAVEQSLRISRVTRHQSGSPCCRVWCLVWL